MLINVEAYKKLPVNSAAIKGEVPKINNLVPYAPFGYYIERKLYIHNMGHAMTAYLGYLNHKTYIWEVLEDEEIAIIVKDAMLASAKALSLKNQVSYEELSEHVDDLLQRFGNWALGDTVARVGRDLGRKLLPNDRMIGALNLCSEMGVNCDGLILGIAAALLFDDTIESDLNKLLKKGDYRKVLVDFCNIKPKDQLFSLIVLAYEKLHKKLDL